MLCSPPEAGNTQSGISHERAGGFRLPGGHLQIMSPPEAGDTISIHIRTNTENFLKNRLQTGAGICYTEI